MSWIPGKARGYRSRASDRASPTAARTPRSRKCRLFQLFSGQKLDDGEDQAPSVDLSGTDRGRAVVFRVVQPADRETDGATPPRRFGDRNRVRGVSGRPRDTG